MAIGKNRYRASAGQLEDLIEDTWRPKVQIERASAKMI